MQPELNGVIIGSILNPLAGKFSKDTRKTCKGAKTGASYDWQSFYLSQYDWLKGSHMTKLVCFRMKQIIHTANLWHQILPIIHIVTIRHYKYDIIHGESNYSCRFDLELP